MVSIGTADLEKIINDLEFENQQYVKEIAKEKDRVEEITVQMEEYKTEHARLKQENTQVGEDTKVHYRQFTQNRANIESLKQTTAVLADQEDALQNKLELLIKKGEQERTERGEILEHYTSEWRDYEKTYATFSLAIKLQQKVAQREQTAERCRQAASQLETVRTQLKEADAKFRPFTDINSFVVKLAEKKVKTLGMQQQTKQQQARCEQLRQQLQQLLLQEEARKKRQVEEADGCKHAAEDDEITHGQQQQQQQQNSEFFMLSMQQEQQQQQQQHEEQQQQWQQQQLQQGEEERQLQHKELQQQQHGQQQQQQWLQLKQQQQRQMQQQQQKQQHQQQHLQFKQLQQHQLQRQQPQQHHHQQQRLQHQQQFEHAGILVDNGRSVNRPVTGGGHSCHNLVSAPRQAISSAPGLRHAVRVLGQPCPMSRLTAVPQPRNINVAVPQHHDPHGQQGAAHQLQATATRPGETASKPRAPASSLLHQFSQVHIRPKKLPVSHIFEIPHLEVPRAPPTHTDTRWQQVLSAPPTRPTPRFQILQPSTVRDENHEAMQLTSTSSAVTIQAKANTVTQRARAQPCPLLPQQHRRLQTPHVPPPQFSCVANTSVMTSDPSPRVMIPDPAQLVMTSDPTQLVMTCDPPRPVYTEPKTPVRPSTSPGQFNLTTSVRAPVAGGDTGETNMAVTASDTMVSVGVDSNTAVSVNNDSTTRSAQATTPGKQQGKITPASTPGRHPPVTPSHATPSQSPVSIVTSSPFDLDKHIARIQTFTKSPGSEFCYHGRPMFGPFSTPEDEEQEMESTPGGPVRSMMSFIKPLFEVAGGDGPGNVFANNINTGGKTPAVHSVSPGFTATNTDPCSAPIGFSFGSEGDVVEPSTSGVFDLFGGTPLATQSPSTAEFSFSFGGTSGKEDNSLSSAGDAFSLF